MAARILVAEDQTDIRDLLVMNLRSAGYEVSAVGAGRAGARPARRARRRPADPRPDDAPRRRPRARCRRLPHQAVLDTGLGIATVDLPHLFDRFYQARQSVAPATGEGGKGLGLAIIKRIAELHAGTVEVISADGAGTEVVLSVPIASA